MKRNIQFNYFALYCSGNVFCGCSDGGEYKVLIKRKRSGDSRWRWRWPLREHFQYSGFEGYLRRINSGFDRSPALCAVFTACSGRHGPRILLRLSVSPRAQMCSPARFSAFELRGGFTVALPLDIKYLSELINLWFVNSNADNKNKYAYLRTHYSFSFYYSVQEKGGKRESERKIS